MVQPMQIEKEPMHTRRWPRDLASGAHWAAIYNGIWGVAWFTFMHREWDTALVAIKHPSPWTSEVWLLWVVLTLPIGVAVMAFVADQARAYRSAVAAAAIVWLLFSLGMLVNGVRAGLSLRVQLLDSVVNLVALLAASVISTRTTVE